MQECAQVQVPVCSERGRVERNRHRRCLHKTVTWGQGTEEITPLMFLLFLSHSPSLSQSPTTLWHFQKFGHISRMYSEHFVSCPATDHGCSFGITKCLYIMSVTQHELFISFHITVWKRREKKNAPMYADRSICVKSHPLCSKSLPIHTPGREQDSYSCP